MPTASWQTGQTSAAAGGSGFGTGPYTTTNASYNPTASRRVVVLVGGLTNNAADFTPGATPVTVTVGAGSAITLTQHPGGWITQTGAGWRPFCTAYYFDSTGSPATNVRFVCDATDDVYQWFVQTVEYTGHSTSDFWGRWGSDLGTAGSEDNQSTALDQNTGLAIGTNSHIVKILAADGDAGAIAPGTNYTERYEGPAGSGQTIYHVSDRQTGAASPAVGGAVTPTVASGGWATFAFEVRDAADGAGVSGTLAETLDDTTVAASGNTFRMPVFVADRGSLANVTSQTSTPVDMAAAGSITVGNTLVVRIAGDNSGGSGAAPTVGITETRGNTWTMLGPANVDPGAANAGSTTWIFYARVVNAYTNGDDLTVTWSPTTAAKAIVIEEWANIRVVNPVVVAATTATGTSTFTGTGIARQPTAAFQLFYAALGAEGPNGDSYTEDSDTTDGVWQSLTRLGSTDATATNNQKIAGAAKLVSGTTSQTWNATITSRDWAAVALVFDVARSGWAHNVTAATTVVASGTVGAGGSTGTLAVTLANTTVAASGRSTHVGTVSQTLANTTSAASGTKTHVGTLAATTAATTSAAAGRSTHVGTLAVTLENTTSAAAGRSTHVGTLAQTTANTTLAAAGGPLANTPLVPVSRVVLVPAGFYDQDTIDLTGFTEGNFVVAYLATRSSDERFNTPSGWYLVHSGGAATGTNSPAYRSLITVVPPGGLGSPRFWLNDNQLDEPGQHDGTKVLVVEEYDLDLAAYSSLSDLVVQSVFNGTLPGGTADVTSLTIDISPPGPDRLAWFAGIGVRLDITSPDGPGAGWNEWAQQGPAINMLWGLGGSTTVEDGSAPDPVFTWASANRSRGGAFAIALANLTGTLAVTLDATTSAAAGRVGHVGTLAQTLANTTVSASGHLPQSGMLAATLANTTVAAAGKVGHVGTLAVTTANTTVAASGHLPQSGTLAVTLANTTVAAAGTKTHVGSLARTLDNTTVAASGSTGSAKIGTLAVTLAATTVVSAGKVGHLGALAVTTANTTSAASGFTTRRGTLAVTLADTVVAATGRKTHLGTVAVVLEGVISTAVGTKTHLGALSVTLAPVTLAAAGAVGDQSLTPIIVDATGSWSPITTAAGSYTPTGVLAGSYTSTVEA